MSDHTFIATAANLPRPPTAGPLPSAYAHIGAGDKHQEISIGYASMPLQHMDRTPRDDHAQQFPHWPHGGALAPVHQRGVKIALERRLWENLVPMGFRISLLRTEAAGNYLMGSMDSCGSLGKKRSGIDMATGQRVSIKEFRTQPPRNLEQKTELNRLRKPRNGIPSQPSAWLLEAYFTSDLIAAFSVADKHYLVTPERTATLLYACKHIVPHAHRALLMEACFGIGLSLCERHRKNILHGDVNAVNVMYRARTKVDEQLFDLIDNGSSEIMGTTLFDGRHDIRTTYCAPEQIAEPFYFGLTSPARSTAALDMWGAGATLLNAIVPEHASPLAYVQASDHSVDRGATLFKQLAFFDVVRAITKDNGIASLEQLFILDRAACCSELPVVAHAQEWQSLRHYTWNYLQLASRNMFDLTQFIINEMLVFSPDNRIDSESFLEYVHKTAPMPSRLDNAQLARDALQRLTANPLQEHVLAGLTTLYQTINGAKVQKRRETCFI